MDAGDGEHLEKCGLAQSMSRGEFGMQCTDQCRVEIVSIGGVVTVYRMFSNIIHYSIIMKVLGLRVKVCVHYQIQLVKSYNRSIEPVPTLTKYAGIICSSTKCSTKQK